VGLGGSGAAQVNERVAGRVQESLMCSDAWFSGQLQACWEAFAPVPGSAFSVTWNLHVIGCKVLDEFGTPAKHLLSLRGGTSTGSSGSLLFSLAGNIRRAEHFVAFLRRLVAHLRERLRTRQACQRG
jgi:hypothetical protein